jgi:NADPH:quinone reductase-like Zn-dependent oxidoreductase
MSDRRLEVGGMTVRAVQLDRPGGIDALSLREVAAPVIEPGQILVRTVASTVNPLDRKTRNKPNLTFPLTLGSDVAGIVVESELPGYRIGDRVIALTFPTDNGIGAWCDLVPLDAAQVAPAPSSVSLAEAATIPLSGLTALQTWNAVRSSPGERVLVTGAAGGIGGFLVQLAVHAGMKVDGLVSRQAHVEPTAALGAGLVTADPEDLPAHSYAAIVDPIALPTKGVDVGRLIAEGGQYVAVGRDASGVPGGQEVSVDDDPAGLRRLAELVDEGVLDLRIAAHYGLSEYAAAYALFESGGLFGKVVLHL